MKPSTPSRSGFECFGLVINGIDFETAVKRIEEMNRQGHTAMIVTANPEILLYARKHPNYWNTLRQADLKLVDSFGLQIAGWVKGARPERVTGVDLAKKLIVLAAERGWKVALLGGGREVPGAPDKAAWELRKDFPNLQIMAEELGAITKDGDDGEAGAEARFRLTHFAPDLILAAFGHPRQEAWMVRHLSEFPNAKVAIGVGGTLDYWSGEKKRAPKCMRTLGFEWLYRLVREPRRWRRIFDAVVVFPLVFVYDKLRKGE
ncbi:WecB/TagA/CpsF family glycosyltransferase [Candidatus Uhrbacteria bacterium]|nr:WecB/TagA/CpsF family glycosyltransferase [Candidatus Uhrbacteria bacterium]